MDVNVKRSWWTHVLRTVATAAAVSSTYVMITDTTTATTTTTVSCEQTQEKTKPTVSEAAESPSNYVIYLSKTGERLKNMKEVAKRGASQKIDVVLCGEVHTNTASHDAELHLLMALQHTSSSLKNPLALSLEMFETDVQSVVDAYIAGLATELDLMRDARPWPTYFQSYHALVSFCKRHRMRVIAANAPRRIVSYIGRHGAASFATRVANARADGIGTMLTPTPWPYAPVSEQLRDKLVEALDGAYGNSTEEVKGTTATTKSPDGGDGDDSPSCPYIGFSEQDARRNAMFDAQALWDASMAHAIANAASDGHVVMHVTGKFHCEQRLGICERLPEPLTKCVVVCVPWQHGGLMEASTFKELELDKLGDIVVLTEYKDDDDDDVSDPHKA